MKKIIIAILSIAIATPTFAQYKDRYNRPVQRSYSQSRHSNYNSYNGNIYWGLRLGLGVSTVSSDDSYLDGGSSQTGLNVGVAVGFQLAPQAPVFLETGLYYIEKGGRNTYSGTKLTYDLNYLEIPIVVKYKAYIDRGLDIEPFAGGYLACGVSGKAKNFNNRVADESFSDDYFQRFDGGIRIGCGLEYQMLYAEMGYDFGLANICHDTFAKSHNGCFFANIGVNF